jgi:cell division FtsZ-interacting protein ZapD
MKDKLDIVLEASKNNEMNSLLMRQYSYFNEIFKNLAKVEDVEKDVETFEKEFNEVKSDNEQYADSFGQEFNEDELIDELHELVLVPTKKNK